MGVTIIKKQGGNIAISVATSPELEAVSSVNEAGGTDTEVSLVPTVGSDLAAASPEVGLDDAEVNQTTNNPNTSTCPALVQEPIVTTDSQPDAVVESVCLPDSDTVFTLDAVSQTVSASYVVPKAAFDAIEFSAHLTQAVEPTEAVAVLVPELSANSIPVSSQEVAPESLLEAVTTPESITELELSTTSGTALKDLFVEVNDISLVDKDFSFEFEEEAAIFSKKVAEAKTEQYRDSVIQAAATKLCAKSLKSLNKKADALTEAKIVELFGNSCLVGSPEFDQKVFGENYWELFQGTLKLVKLDFSESTEVQNEAILLVELGKFDFDDYHATAYTDALNKFKKAYDSNDFNHKPYSVLKAEIYQQYLN